MPAAAYVEECLESSLSVLARHAKTDTRATTVQHFSDLYIQENSDLSSLPPCPQNHCVQPTHPNTGSALFHCPLSCFGQLVGAPVRAALGATSDKERDRQKPGMSKMFPHRVASRVREMLHILERRELPGVVPSDKVKTRGSHEWQGGGVVNWLLLPASAADSALGLHAVVTLLDGGNRLQQAKAAVDAVGIRLLAEFAPLLSPQQMEREQGSNTQVTLEVRKLIREGKRLRRAAPPRPATPEPEVQVVEPEAPEPEARGRPGLPGVRLLGVHAGDDRPGTGRWRRRTGCCRVGGRGGV